jgi:septum site-determining protein MinC
MPASPVVIKGTSEGLIIELGQGDLQTILRELDQKLGQSARFFRGGRVALRVGSRLLNRDEIEALGNVLYKWEVTLWAVEADLPETRAAADSLGLETSIRPASRPPAPSREEPAAEEKEPAGGWVASEGLLVRRTLRSGASLVHRGHIVVVGDVNPGAEVIAGGDIVIWGTLRGMAHAGAGGDEGAVICALRFRPEQVRIADVVSTHVQEPAVSAGMPHMAALRDRQIVLEPWIEGIGAAGRHPKDVSRRWSGFWRWLRRH